ncbi:phage late control D family protein [Maritalea porphyrae]|uniref:phage late control D family protein n=1 Tax=Maritalea porphyrae TaxID=880732 RepID=UPI0022AFEB44|nr:contractile injection system protein, VgrG/Pvc8 family [Maritalea porphyrae]MCZ4272471.1 contractile injection system protein, VgrG/Pvc8 family [Maritalea porphyrae]
MGLKFVNSSVFSAIANGNNLTEKFAGRLISIDVTDSSGSESDTATITLDDKTGSWAFPSPGAEISIGMGFLQATELFAGVVDEVRSVGDRNGGRLLNISANSADLRGKLKETKQLFWDDKTVQQILNEAGEEAGLDGVKVDRKFASVIREYEAMDGEDFMAFGRRLAGELGGTFKVRGKNAILAARNDGQTVSGAAMPVFRVVAGRNLVSWDVVPDIGRPRHSQFGGRYYDFAKAKWVEQTAKSELGDVEQFLAAPFANQSMATSSAQSSKTESERNAGEGSISFIGSLLAQAEGFAIVKGARHGVDGAYVMDTVNHHLNRSSGYMGDAQLAKPHGGAGKDNR